MGCGPGQSMQGAFSNPCGHYTASTVLAAIQDLASKRTLHRLLIQVTVRSVRSARLARLFIMREPFVPSDAHHRLLEASLVNTQAFD